MCLPSQGFRLKLTVAFQLARLMLMYPIAYMLIWALPTSVRIYQVATGRPAPFALQTVDKVYTNTLTVLFVTLSVSTVLRTNSRRPASWFKALLTP